MKPIILALALVLGPAASSAGSVAATPVRAEIDALLSKLQASDCQFNRNGAWHSGAEAKEHLQRKFDYLERRGAIDSAEKFIELAASRSSTTGKVYLLSAAARRRWKAGAGCASNLPHFAAARVQLTVKTVCAPVVAEIIR